MISFNTIPNEVNIPFFAMEIDNSAAFTPSMGIQTLLVGQKLAGGTAEAGKPVNVGNAQMARSLFGRGSVLARMVESFRENNAFATLVCLPVEDADSSNAASGKFTIAGEATENGKLSFYVCQRCYSIAVSAGLTAEKVASALANMLKEDVDSPVTASASAGAVSLTAKNKGALGNDIQLSVNLRGAINGEKPVAGLSVKITEMSGGAKDPEMKGVFDVLRDEPYELIVTPYSEASALDEYEKLMNFSTGRWSWTKQIYGHVYTAKRGDFNTLCEFGKLRNDPNATIIGVEEAQPNDVVSILGAVGGRLTAFIAEDTARPLHGGVLEGMMSTPVEGRFDNEVRNTLLANGIATLLSSTGLPLQTERIVTTYQRNLSGDKDRSYFDAITMHNIAYCARYIAQNIKAKFNRHILVDDGTQVAPGKKVVTPNVIRSEVISLYKRLERDAKVENTEMFKKHLIVARNESDPNRVDFLLTPDMANQMNVFAALFQFHLQFKEE